MEKVKQLERQITRGTVLFISLLILVSVIIFRSAAVVMGLIFGSLIALLNFIELSKTLQKAVTKPPSEASTYTTFKYFIRYIIMAVVLYVAATSAHIDLLATVCGLLSVKLIVYITNLFNDRQFYKNIFSRKEEKL